MTRKAALLLMVFAMVAGIARPAISADRFIQLAEVKVDPMQVVAYQSALRKEIAETTQREAGVIVLYAVAHNADPSRVTLLEIYASRKAYEAHRQSASFKTYKTATARMVQSLTLIPCSPILLGGQVRPGDRP